MGIQISAEQVAKLSPDDTSNKAGMKMAALKHWTNLGQDEAALWGECKGSSSTPYKVGIASSTLSTRCSCPSNKYPCKHALGLLYLTVSSGSSIATTTRPEWIEQWLNAATEARQRKEAAAAAKASAPPSANKAKSMAQREDKVLAGIEQLDLWLNDLIRNGLGNLSQQSMGIWDERGAQLINAQAPGLAARVRSMGAIPFTSTNWMPKLLGQLGKTALLTEAYQHPERYDDAMRATIRQLVGWTYQEIEIIQQGERVKDEWLILGQMTEEKDQTYTRRTWLHGLQSQRNALVLQFSKFQPAFAATYPLGVKVQAELAFWPGKLAERALIIEHSDLQPLPRPLPGAATLAELSGQIAQQLSQQPWMERFLCVVRDCVPLHDVESRDWFLQDKTGDTLPLRKQDGNWEMLIYSGGTPVDFVGEWNGEALLPLALQAEDSYHLL
ncbi:SWIM zinc finger family protein [Ktedonobacteria bacterium brp13]|nr:SWIM zinc finger family protein [Ktedonobacteria bacterium brp13]